MKRLMLLLVVSVAVGAQAFDVETVITRMDSAGRKTVIGKDSGCGSYVVCRRGSRSGKRRQRGP